MTGSEARANAESAVRQMAALGMTPRQPINPDEIEAAAERAEAERQKPATKADIEAVMAKLSDLESQFDFIRNGVRRLLAANDAAAIAARREELLGVGGKQR